MGFPHPGTGQSMRRIRYKPGNIQSIIMLSFSLLSLAIMLVTVVVMYIKFADASQDSIIESNHKVMDQTIDSVEKLSGQYEAGFGCGVLLCNKGE